MSVILNFFLLILDMAFFFSSLFLNENFSIFTEYQFTASDNKVSLRNGGTLNTKLLTNAVNLGVSYNF